MLISGIIPAGHLYSDYMVLYNHISGSIVFNQNVGIIWEFLDAQEHWRPLPYSAMGLKFDLPRVIFALLCVRICLTAAVENDIKYQVELLS